MRSSRILGALVLSGAALLWASWPSHSAASDQAVRNLSVLTADEMQQPLAACPMGVTTSPWTYCNAGSPATGCLTTFTGYGTICTGCNATTTGTSCSRVTGVTWSAAGPTLVGSFACASTYTVTPCVSVWCGCGSCCTTGAPVTYPCGSYNAGTGPAGGC